MQGAVSCVSTAGASVRVANHRQQGIVGVNARGTDEWASSSRRCRGLRLRDLPKATTEFTEMAAEFPAANWSIQMRLRIWVYLIFALFLATEGLFGQEYRGSLSGRVLDPSGAAVPGAHLTLTNTATNVRLMTDTNAEGNYTIPYLQPGMYSLHVEQPGFKAFERSPIEVRANQALQVDAKLDLGSSTETVNVQAETPLLDAASASVGQTIDSRRLEELPVRQGVPWHLIALSAGVISTATNTLDENPYDGTVTWYSVTGASATANLLSIDGAAGGQFNGSPSFTPPQEAVGELQVMTSNYTATQGFTQGGNMNVSLKSGTNAPHGSVYWYGGGNGSLIANQYFNVVRGLPKSPSGPYFRRGFAIGGPVYIPKIHDGRNQTFFFISYEGIHRTQVLTQSLTVPTVPERSGDFSALLPLGSTYQLYDPFSRQPAANGRVSSTPLAGNFVPKNRQDAIGMGLLKYWPSPNQAGQPDGSLNFYCNNSGQSNQYWGMTLRLDHNFGARHRVYGTMYRSDRINQDYNIFQNDVSGDSWNAKPRGGLVDYVFMVSPSLIVDSRLGFDDNDLHIDALGPAVLNWTYAANGFPAYMDSLVDPQIKRMPGFNPSGIQGAPPGAALSFNVRMSYTPSVHFTKTRGAHTMNFGWDAIVRRVNNYAPGIAATGSYNFNGTYLAGPLDNSPQASIGPGLAQMEYGLPTSSSMNRVPSSASQSVSHAFFLQDDWRVNQKLTVNLGLRYEHWGPTAERFDRATAGWDPNASLPIAAQAQAAYLLNPTPEVSQLPVHGGLVFAGAGGLGHSLGSGVNDWMPRIGIAYSLNDKTVIHTGYGIFYGPLGLAYQSVRQDGFSRTTTANASLDNGLTYPSPLSNPFPTGVLEPVGAGLGPMTNAGNSITVYVMNPKGLYAQRWEFNVQRELPWRMVVTAGYNGSRQTRLSTSRNLDALANIYLSRSPVRDQATIDYLSRNIANPFKGLIPGASLGTNSTVARSQLLIPYPQFTGVSFDTQQGYGWYHGLSLTAEKRMSKGFTVQGSYTWSKAMEASSFLNGGDSLPTEMISSVDRPHYLALSSIYELPIGRGRALLGNTSRAVDILAGGWQLEAMYRFQSGPPIGFSNALLNSSCTWRDITLPADKRSWSHWFNTGCFVTASNQQLSSNLVTMPSRFSWLRADSLNVADFSAIKRFRFTERANLEFKIEFMNALNRVWLGSPTTSPTSGSFGIINAEQSAPRRVYWSGHVNF
ncbi:MAG: TonB-dependent receptor [Acidobacteriia bacterium]|nr:TonB-dependent receptor [Terriglobia bacterium]